jgi:hypothetical protein
VNRDISPAFKYGDLDVFGKHPSATEDTKRRLLISIAFCFNNDDLTDHGWVTLAKQPCDNFSLCEG